MRGFAQLYKILVGTQHGVNAAVVGCVVAVGGECHENGVQVQSLHTQVMEIGQLGLNTLQVAAVKIVVQDLALFIGAEHRHILQVFMDPVGLQLIGAVALAFLMEAVGENLIEHAALECLRHRITVGDTAELPQITGLHIGIVPLLEQTELFIAGGNPEIVVEQARFLEAELGGVVFVRCLHPVQCELHFPEQCAVFMLQHQRHMGSLAGLGDSHSHGADLLRRDHAEGLLVSRILAVV